MTESAPKSFSDVSFLVDGKYIHILDDGGIYFADEHSGKYGNLITVEVLEGGKVAFKSDDDSKYYLSADMHDNHMTWKGRDSGVWEQFILEWGEKADGTDEIIGIKTYDNKYVHESTDVGKGLLSDGLYKRDDLPTHRFTLEGVDMAKLRQATEQEKSEADTEVKGLVPDYVEIKVGPSSEVSRDWIELPEFGMTVSNVPINVPINDSSSLDTFKTYVLGNYLQVTRTDKPDGWSQDLVLAATPGSEEDQERAKQELEKHTQEIDARLQEQVRLQEETRLQEEKAAQLQEEIDDLQREIDKVALRDSARGANRIPFTVSESGLLQISANDRREIIKQMALGAANWNGETHTLDVSIETDTKTIGMVDWTRDNCQASCSAVVEDMDCVLESHKKTHFMSKNGLLGAAKALRRTQATDTSVLCRAEKLIHIDTEVRSKGICKAENSQVYVMQGACVTHTGRNDCLVNGEPHSVVSMCTAFPHSALSGKNGSIGHVSVALVSDDPENELTCPANHVAVGICANDKCLDSYGGDVKLSLECIEVDKTMMGGGFSWHLKRNNKLACDESNPYDTCPLGDWPNVRGITETAEMHVASCPENHVVVGASLGWSLDPSLSVKCKPVLPLQESCGDSVEASTAAKILRMRKLAKRMTEERNESLKSIHGAERALYGGLSTEGFMSLQRVPMCSTVDSMERCCCSKDTSGKRCAFDIEGRCAPSPFDGDVGVCDGFDVSQCTLDV